MVSDGDNGGRDVEHGLGPRLRALASPKALAIVALFAAAPFVSFLNHNRAELIDDQARQVVLVTVAVAALALLVLAGMALVIRRAPVERLAVALGVVLFLSFNFQWYDLGRVDLGLFELGGLRTQVLAWLAVAVAGGATAFAAARHPSVVSYALVASLIFSVIPAAEYVQSQLAEDSGSFESAEPIKVNRTDEDVRRPNIYVFLADGYPSNALLDAFLGFDNEPFARSLESRGFFVSRDSYSNYPMTRLSIASMLEMDYVVEGPADLKGGVKQFVPLLRGKSRFVETARGLEYRYVHAEPGTWQYTACGGDLEADLCIPASDTGFGIDELQQSLLRITPLDAVFRGLKRGPYKVTKNADDAFAGLTTPAAVISQLHERAAEVDEPFLLFSHLFNPHPPYRYRPDCSPQPGAPIGGTWWSAPNSKRLFTDQIQCLNSMFERSVDAILAEDPNAVIVITADHGMWFPVAKSYDFEALSGMSAAARFGAFLAMRLPDDCVQPGPEARTVVNTFRIVGACLGWFPPDYLDHRVFRAWYEEHDRTDELAVDELDALVRGHRRK